MESKEKALRVQEIKSAIEGKAEQILGVLPDPRQRERMLRVFQNAVTRNEALLRCTKLSVLTALATAGAFGLEPNSPLGHCHIIPYKNKKTGMMDAQFQMGYQGCIELARRAKCTITPGIVHENDDFAMDKGTASFLRHIPTIKGDPGNVIGYYAIARSQDFEPYFEYWSIQKVVKHAAQYSQSYRSGDATCAWFNAFDAMAMKTLVWQVGKYAPRALFGDSVSVMTGDVGAGNRIVSALTDDDVIIPLSEPVIDLSPAEPSQDAPTDEQPTKEPTNKTLVYDRDDPARQSTPAMSRSRRSRTTAPAADTEGDIL